LAINIDLSNLPKYVNPHFRSLFTDDHSLNVLVGGSDSSKSYSTAQKVIYKTLTKKGIRWIVARKVKKDVRHSCFDLLIAVIRGWGLERLFKVNNTELTITCTLNGNDIICVGLDDVDKLKSIFDPTDFWLEEADQASDKDVQQLRLRLRSREGNTSVHQGILTMNPIWAGHWIKREFFDKKHKNVLTHHSTYKDNLFLDKQTIDYLKSITDPYYKSVYVEGNWGIYGNVVFHNYVIEDFKYTEDDLKNVFNGIDYGFVHASAFERGGYKDNDIYIFDEVYGKGWTNADFIEACEDRFGDEAKDWYIKADSSEPDRIEEWFRNGYHRIEAAKKGPGSLKYGIDYLCSKKIHIHETKCPKLANEIQQFKRAEDKHGEVIDKFVEVNDDAIAALRYGTEPIWSNEVYGMDNKRGVTLDQIFGDSDDDDF
jgi:phage terminase large subunit